MELFPDEDKHSYLITAVILVLASVPVLYFETNHSQGFNVVGSMVNLAGAYWIAAGVVLRKGDREKLHQTITNAKHKFNNDQEANDRTKGVQEAIPETDGAQQILTESEVDSNGDQPSVTEANFNTDDNLQVITVSKEESNVVQKAIRDDKCNPIDEQESISKFITSMIETQSKRAKWGVVFILIGSLFQILSQYI